VKQRLFFDRVDVHGGRKPKGSRHQPTVEIDADAAISALPRSDAAAPWTQQALDAIGSQLSFLRTKAALAGARLTVFVAGLFMLLALAHCRQQRYRASADAGTKGSGATPVTVVSTRTRVDEQTTFTAMGGIPVNIRVWDVSIGTLARWQPRLRQRIEALEQQFSTHRPASLLSQLNRRGQVRFDQPAQVQLLSRALRWAERTDGAFDPTVGPLVELWRDAARKGNLPTAAQLDATRRQVGYRAVQLEEASGVVRLSPGCRVDLAAIAKGYVVEQVATLLQGVGIERGLVEIGGDVQLFNRPPPADPFHVGIQHPLRKGIIGELTVERGGVATSGCYHRYVEIGKEKICHVIDPRSGRAVQGLLSASVVAANATDADALATAMLVLGAPEAQRLAASLPEVEAVLVVPRSVDNGGYEVIVTEGLRNRMSFTVRSAPER